MAWGKLHLEADPENFSQVEAHVGPDGRHHLAWWAAGLGASVRAVRTNLLLPLVAVDASHTTSQVDIPALAVCNI